MPYPTEALVSRAVIRPNVFALIPPGGLVNNTIPGFNKCWSSILASPKMGASFVHYSITVQPDGSCDGFGDEGIETFIFVRSGTLRVAADDTCYELSSGGYLYLAPGQILRFSNASSEDVRVILYKQRFVPLPNSAAMPWTVFGTVNEIPKREYDGMANVTMQDLLPTDIVFDMNMHILCFQPGGCHPFVETHIQEHGAHILSGEGLYNLGNEWYTVRKEDYIWFGPYVPQAAYATGLEPLTYIYSKDCNRDAAI